MTAANLHGLLRETLAVPAPPAVVALAARLAALGGPATAAVLYYGSNLRSGDVNGILDFYVLLDRVGAWPGSWFTRLANRLLPPNVGYAECEIAGQPLRSKNAVISVAQFQRRMQLAAIDTTLWARFCQPTRCVWSRSGADLDQVVAALAAGASTAAQWAAALGPRTAPPQEYWRTLFAHTYSTELRVETGGRAADIAGKDPEYYALLLPAAWQACGMPFRMTAEGQAEVQLDPARRRRLQRAWIRRARLGKPLNVLRLLKATFTFDGALDYVVWKIERHRGERITVTPWQRRHPLLAAPGLYLQLRRRGVL